ncbi:hypothetical protein [Arthrobacter bambusae]|uniref:hypothetical protein n=1 Tax=Arthrobacter bambusae TaxID=1338426 RepID=UPI00278AD874|nr:hypothetical protein [Arthrobacter bambusae]MDQ0028788.1 drug/metabolite transporter (DMT)-like permease [Arthrobacter bambusae]MDQ0096418.1 drug/metabolite transporter (DMT)-like permease [Arthrobacter bambusae]
MATGSVIALVLGVIQLFMGRVGHEGHEVVPGALPVAQTGQVGLAIVVALLVSWMSWKNWQGRKWARTLTRALGILTIAAAAAALLTFGSKLSVIACVAYALSASLSVIVLALISRKVPKDFYVSHRRVRPRKIPVSSAPAQHGTSYIGHFSDDRKR